MEYLLWSDLSIKTVKKAKQFTVINIRTEIIYLNAHIKSFGYICNQLNFGIRPASQGHTTAHSCARAMFAHARINRCSVHHLAGSPIHAN